MQESKTIEVRATMMKALVIGISDYSNAGDEYKDLPHCVRDANAVAKLLEEKLNF